MFNPFQSSPQQSAPQMRQGPCFRYAVPPGWQVAEDGQFAVVLVAPDQAALTILVGNCGLPPGTHPGQFVYQKLAQNTPGLRMGEGRPSAPLDGFSSAYDFDYAYVMNGIPCRGLATCHIAPSYDMCTMAITAAASQEAQWGHYAGWLPQIARSVQITNPAAFGASGIAQQNLANSIALGEQARQNREASQQQWDDVTRQRWESDARNNADFREALGNVQTWTNPYGHPTVELTNEYSHYWMNRQGQIVGTNDPSANPNVGSTGEWAKMQQPPRTP